MNACQKVTDDASILNPAKAFVPFNLHARLKSVFRFVPNNVEECLGNNLNGGSLEDINNECPQMCCFQHSSVVGNTSKFQWDWNAGN